jgi:hypothetical protein
LARLLAIPEAEIEPDYINAEGRGWSFVFDLMPKALRRFYGRCARFAVIGLDNDGNSDLVRSGLPEDPQRPRHWRHALGSAPTCRCCQLHACAEATRPLLNWLPGKPGVQWPILITVPVEMIEAWLLISLAFVDAGSGSLYAENEPRHGQKRQFYGKPAATQADVETRALPLLRTMTEENLATLETYSKSFAQFAEQVRQHRGRILDESDCWQPQLD